MKQTGLIPKRMQLNLTGLRAKRTPHWTKASWTLLSLNANRLDPKRLNVNVWTHDKLTTTTNLTEIK